MVLNKIRYDKMIQKRLDGQKGYPSYYKFVMQMFDLIDDIKEVTNQLNKKIETDLSNKKAPGSILKPNA